MSLYNLLLPPYRLARALGVDPRQTVRAVLGLPRFIRTALAYRRLESERIQMPLRWAHLNPCLRDWTEPAGAVATEYFWQDLWAATKIAGAQPENHVDIGSRLDGFVAHLLCFMPVTVVDIRPLSTAVPRLTFVQDDATILKGFADLSVSSLSSLHAIEHFGLGRYGDPLDPDAPFKCLSSLKRVLSRNGRLYLSVPIGRERLEFNAHRVFAPSTILNACSGLRLLSFSAIADNGALRPSEDPERFNTVRYACGLFEFTKD